MNKKSLLTLATAIFVSTSYVACQATKQNSIQASEPQKSAPTTKPKPQKVYHIGGDVTHPRVIPSPQPQLDEQQIKKLNAGKKVKRTGSIFLKVVVGEDGTVRSATVIESFDHDLDAKAIEGAKHLKFEPATKKGVPVAVELVIKVDFRLYK